MKMRMVFDGVVEFEEDGQITRLDLRNAKIRLESVVKRQSKFATQDAYNEAVQTAKDIISFIETNTI